MCYLERSVREESRFSRVECGDWSKEVVVGIPDQDLRYGVVVVVATC